MWIGRPSATRPASLIASESVGCGAMPSATVSTVDSASMATTPASTMSVTCGPTMTRPSSSPYRVSWIRSEEHTSELQSPYDLVCRLLLEKKKKKNRYIMHLGTVIEANPCDDPLTRQ